MNPSRLARSIARGGLGHDRRDRQLPNARAGHQWVERRERGAADLKAMNDREVRVRDEQRVAVDEDPARLGRRERIDRDGLVGTDLRSAELEPDRAYLAVVRQRVGGSDRHRKRVGKHERHEQARPQTEVGLDRDRGDRSVFGQHGEERVLVFRDREVDRSVREEHLAATGAADGVDVLTEGAGGVVLDAARSEARDVGHARVVRRDDDPRRHLADLREGEARHADVGIDHAVEPKVDRGDLSARGLRDQRGERFGLGRDAVEPGALVEGHDGPGLGVVAEERDRSGTLEARRHDQRRILATAEQHERDARDRNDAHQRSSVTASGRPTTPSWRGEHSSVSGSIPSSIRHVNIGPRSITRMTDERKSNT